MASYNIELNSKPIMGSNEHTLLLRVTVNRKHTRLKLDHAIQTKHFNPNPKQNKYVRSTHSKHALINADIDDLIQKAKEAVRTLDKENLHISSQSIKQRMVRGDYSSIIEYANSFVDIMESNGQVGSAKKYKTLIKRLSDYSETGDLLFIEITHAFLEKFNHHLLSLGNSHTTVGKYFKALRTVYNRASAEGLTDQLKDPFVRFKIKSEESSKERLNITEIRLIEDLALPEGSLIWHVKNAFLFSFYCAGIRVSDLIQMKWSNIVGGRLVYQMQKTKRGHSLKLVDSAIEVLDLYDRNESEDFIFPFFNTEIDYSNPLFLFNQIGSKTALLNKYLKVIATKAGIEKKISTHTARHSFADIARQKTDNIYNLSKTLGHSSIKITEAYLASFDEKAVDDTMDEVFK